MGTLSVTHSFTDATTAEAAEVNQNFTDVETVVNGGIDTTNLANNAVTAAKIAASTITSAEMANNSIVADAIAGNAVETAKINAEAVTQAKLEHTIASSGCLLLRTGADTTNNGTEGLYLLRMVVSVTVTQAAVTAATATAPVSAVCSYSSTNLLDESGSQTLDTTELCVAGVEWHQTVGAVHVDNMPDKMWITSIGATSLTVGFVFPGTLNDDPSTADLHITLVSGTDTA